MRQSLLKSLRTYPWLHHLICLYPLMLVLCGLGVVFESEETMARFFLDLRPFHPVIDGFMLAFTYGATPAFYLLYGWFFWKGYKENNAGLKRLALAYVIAQVLLSFLLVRLLKMAVGKPRPMSMLGGEGYLPFTLEHGNHSFPSGHTAEIIGSAATLAARKKRLFFSLGMGFLIALVGFSRIYLSMHHLWDIAAGMVIGTLVSLLIHHICTREAS